MEADWSDCLQTLEGHKNDVSFVACSHDGQQIISASLYYANNLSERRKVEVKIWDTRSGACLKTLEYRHANSIFVDSIAFSHNCKQIAFGTSSNTVMVIDVGSGVCVKTLEGHSDRVVSVAFSSDDQLIMSGSSDHTIKIWNASSGACLRTLEGAKFFKMFFLRGSAVAFSYDGQLVALAQENGEIAVRAWDASSDALLQTLRGHSVISSLTISPNGRLIASGSADGTVRVWDVHSGDCLNTVKGHSHYIM